MGHYYRFRRFAFCSSSITTDFDSFVVFPFLMMLFLAIVFLYRVTEACLYTRPITRLLVNLRKLLLRPNIWKQTKMRCHNCLVLLSLHLLHSHCLKISIRNVGVANTNWVIMAICLENPCMKSRKIRKTNRVIGFRVFAFFYPSHQFSVGKVYCSSISQKNRNKVQIDVDQEVSCDARLGSLQYLLQD
jgi:hypothetical protein